jgi:hypothetical protein
MGWEAREGEEKRQVGRWDVGGEDTIQREVGGIWIGGSSKHA